EHDEIKKISKDDDADDEQKKFREKIKTLLKINFHIGGLYRLGWFIDTAMEKKFSWKSPPKGKSKELTDHDEEKLAEFFVGSKDYADELESVPDGGNIRLDLVYVWVAEVVKPYLALIKTHDYIKFMTEAMQDIVRSGIRRTYFAKLEDDEKKSSLGPFIFSEARGVKGDKSKNKSKDKDRILERKKSYGFEIKDIAIKDIDPSEDEVKTLLRGPAESELEAKAMAEKAKGQANKDKIEADGKLAAAEFDAKRTVLLAEADQKKRVAETGGAISGALKDVREEVGELTPKMQMKVLETVQQSISSDGKQLQHIKLEGFGGGGGDPLVKIASQLGVSVGVVKKLMDTINSATADTKPTQSTDAPKVVDATKIELANQEEVAKDKEKKPKVVMLSREEEEERMKKLFQSEEKENQKK
ncbi:hypothetical protein L6252_00295, partial [Candidatus Parcubacteria bacterium]|nr:hypothetical protein [Patescibacteria group bacterium]MCG2689712.1 hypothetical protein [Candidatus Parcubacteria bacterium]